MGDSQTYDEVALRCPCTYFSANPVFCLRSRYFYDAKPPCVYHVPGKEHLMLRNPELGVHYQTWIDGNELTDSFSEQTSHAAQNTAVVPEELVTVPPPLRAFTGNKSGTFSIEG